MRRRERVENESEIGDEISHYNTVKKFLSGGDLSPHVLLSHLNNK